MNDNKNLEQAPKSNTKDVFIIVIEDLLRPSKVYPVRIYFTTRCEEGIANIKFTGQDITIGSKELLAKFKNIKSYNEAIELIEKENLEKEILTIPWNKVTRIKTLKFNLNK